MGAYVMQSLLGPGPVSIEDVPTTLAAPLWHRCHGLTSGLPSAAPVASATLWPAGLERPFDREPEVSLPTREALVRPCELRALGVAVVPCLALTGGRPALVVPVPAGTGWPTACHTLVAAAKRAQLGGRRGRRDELVHAVSHDLRGPLLGAAHLIDLALDGPEVGAPERQALQQAGREVLTAARRLEALHRLLRLDGTPPAPQRVDAGALVRTLAVELEATWPHLRRRLSVAPVLQVHADPRQLQAALRELLDNAFKFSHRAETPEVTVSLHTVPGYAVLAVTDNGPGFSAGHADQLFGLFQRVHLASEFPGLGAGLALVRCMAERHGGWAWADLGTPGRTTFLLALPAAGPHHD
jgi:signal transduction histidine kinase